VDIILSDLFWASRPRSQYKAYVLMPTIEVSWGVKTHSDKSAEQLLQNTDQSMDIVGAAVGQKLVVTTSVCETSSH
jgi:NitT/TauT family transport system substrate-binding protein